MQSQALNSLRCTIPSAEPRVSTSSPARPSRSTAAATCTGNTCTSLEVHGRTRDLSHGGKSSLLQTAGILVWLVASFGITAAAQSQFKSLVSFTGVNGSLPGIGALVQGADGTFYGTTYFGGPAGVGTVFKVTPSGALTSLYSFCRQSPCADGEYPMSGLAIGNDGDLYGTTVEGGDHGDGTVYKITPSGVLTTLHSFQPPPDGSGPAAGLLLGTDGSFYGTTQAGGTNNRGAVFKMTPSGETIVIYSFTGGADGDLPYAGIIQTSDGNFYGTTFEGGVYASGTIYRLTPAGTLTVLYNFCVEIGCADGEGAVAALLQASDGNFYGTTEGGGNAGAGTFFRLTSDGTYTSLFSFCGQFLCDAGTQPLGALVEASDGNFYGTTSIGGPYYYYGTVFEITPAGVLTTLHNFHGRDGTAPWAGLVRGQDGFYYGTTAEGGVAGTWNGNRGTIFRIDVSHSCATCQP
jgi:uncharacterized repeat protein (TIGR03803 family)